MSISFKPVVGRTFDLQLKIIDILNIIFKNRRERHTHTHILRDEAKREFKNSDCLYAFIGLNK
jgi:hypothetical protein